MTTAKDTVGTEHPVADFIDPEFFADPGPALAWLQENEPVHFYDPRPRYHEPVWVVTKSADIKYVSTRTEVYCNSQGVQFSSTAVMEPPDDPRFELAIAMPEFLDDPIHGRERRMLRDYFKAKAVMQHDGLISAVVDEVLDPIEPGSVHDFTEAVAIPVPLLVMCDVLGVDRSHSADFRRWTSMLAESFEPDANPAIEPILEMFDFFEAELRRRREEPRDDLISRIEAAADEEGPLHEHRKIAWCWSLLLAGQDTSTSTLTGGVRSLCDHPDQQRILVAEPELMEGAVDEMIRFETPVWYNLRTATEDTELRGVEIAAGEKVYLSWLAANRDPEVYPDPWRFDVRRAPKGQMSFGHGPHFCLGQHLARFEARLVFLELLRRFPNLEWGGEPRRDWSTIINLPGRNPVRFR